MSWLVNRNVVIVIITLAVSFPLSLHRDIVKLSKSSGFGTSPLQYTVWHHRRPELRACLDTASAVRCASFGQEAPRESDV